ncbi:hypothetical protein BH11ACT3_BH11ACT3_14950 [soil metagenome]
MASTDFDFLFGEWIIHNRKIRDNTDAACTEWIEFDARGEASPILGGAGNVDQMWVDDSPQGAFVGFTMRLWSPVDQRWRIWWSDTGTPGVLDEPVIGLFVEGRGRFECVQNVGGSDVLVRFEWTVDADAPQWNQFFSRDEGATWDHNWTMSFSRVN